MKIGIIRFPGSSGADELIRVIEGYYNHQTIDIWQYSNQWPDVEIVFIPGGNSYNDFPRPGVMARFTPIMDKVADFAYNGGCVIGIGNGFQILCEAGLLPGTFTYGRDDDFLCDFIYAKADNNDTALTLIVNKDAALKLPVAHATGKYYVDQEILSIMRQNHQILFRYCDSNSRISEDIVPDGSIENIAGICSMKKNIYGMMLRPERAVLEDSESKDGRVIFESLFMTLNI